MANNPYVNKVVYGGQTLIDISDTTAVASDVAQGKYFYGKDGVKTLGTASGGGLTTQIVLPEQSITATEQEASGYDAYITNLISEELIDDTNYIVTLDGVSYLCRTNYISSWNGIVAGDANLIWGSPTTSVYPFFLARWDNNQTTWSVADNSAHTVKIGRVVSYDESILTTKSITANGTYNASSDSADGYSSVTVNVPSSSPTIQSLTVTPTTSQQTFNASGVDGYKPVTVSGVSQTNLTADNIKNGTTVTISNGTSNIYSVTGTYSGGGGGASNFVTGEFTVPTYSSSVKYGEVSIPYTGSGYPISAIVFVKGGVYNSTNTGQSTWYTGIKRYAVGFWSMVKSNTTTAPDYNSTTNDTATVVSVYKNSTSTSNSYTRTSVMGASVFGTSNPATNVGSGVINFRNNVKTLRYAIGNGAASTYGLYPQVTYVYQIVYSS